MAQDYYKILGVKETDSKDTIKKAYRDAVKRLHPDARGGGFDKNRFYEIQEAYETLGDEERRRRYDASRDATSPRQWQVRRMEGIFPGGRDFLNVWMASRKNRPSLHGGFPGRGERGISHQATVTLTSREARRGVQMTLHVPLEGPCGFCGGRGVMGLFTCPFCGGQGRNRQEFPIRVVIPAGIEDGAKMRISFEDLNGNRHVVILSIEIDWFT